MLRTLKHKCQGFLLGVVVTVFCMGFWQINIRFSAGPEAMELSQTEQIATKLAQVMPPEKPRMGK